MKAAATKFRGVFSFIVTPTKDDAEAVDESRLREAIDYQISQGVHGITVFGSTGGMGSFSESERQRVIEVAAKHIDGRVVFLPGTGSITTGEAIRLSQFAESAGADGVLVVPINYWKPTDNELYGHYEAIARAVQIPVGIYNNPGTTGVDIKPALVARIAKIDNIGFIKESSGDMSRISAIRQLSDYQIAVLNGNDACTPEAIAAGVEGWFAGSGNFMPGKCVELFRLGYERKDIDAHARVLSVHVSALRLHGREGLHPRRAHRVRPARPTDGSAAAAAAHARAGGSRGARRVAREGRPDRRHERADRRRVGAPAPAGALPSPQDYSIVRTRIVARRRSGASVARVAARRQLAPTESRVPVLSGSGGVTDDCCSAARSHLRALRRRGPSSPAASRGLRCRTPIKRFRKELELWPDLIACPKYRTSPAENS